MVRKPQQNRFRSLISGTILTLTAAFISFLLAEGLIRLLFKNDISLTPRYHTVGDYGDVKLRRIRPNMVFSHTTPDGQWDFTTNSQGFRNYVDFDYQKKPGVIRIAAMGDSHTQGYECQQNFTYAAVIQRYLRRRGHEVEVMNTGVSGFSTAEVVALLENEVAEYSPDFVVYGFFANDYEDNLKAGLYELSSDGALRMVKQQHLPGVWIQDLIYEIPGIQWLGENSYFYSLLFNTVWDFFKHQLTASAKEEGENRELAVASKEVFTDYETNLAAALISKLSDLSDSIDARLIVLDIPQAEPSLQFQPSLNNELQRVAAEEADLYVNTDILEIYQGVAPIHVPHGGRHITEFAHTLYGVQIAEWIHQQLITY